MEAPPSASAELAASADAWASCCNLWSASSAAFHSAELDAFGPRLAYPTWARSSAASRCTRWAILAQRSSSDFASTRASV
eukprot:3121769-Pyramimonas_sp.AAC.1